VALGSARLRWRLQRGSFQGHAGPQGAPWWAGSLGSSHLGAQGPSARRRDPLTMQSPRCWACHTNQCRQSQGRPGQALRSRCVGMGTCSAQQQVWCARCRCRRPHPRSKQLAAQITLLLLSNSSSVRGTSSWGQPCTMRRPASAVELPAVAPLPKSLQNVLPATETKSSATLHAV
jgi:hypothetical protein